MLFLDKSPDHDFVILNLSDPQLGNGEWNTGNKNEKILTYTVTELINRVHPDLITLTGDLAWADNDISYDCLADFLDTFKIPWAFVFGNHDNQHGAEPVDNVVKRYMQHPYCLFEKGDARLGNGNYVICIEENHKPVESLIMMDTHDNAPFVNEKGETVSVWAKLIPEQLDWYQQQTNILAERGCPESILMLHIPIYAYQDAWNAAFAPDLDPKQISVQESYQKNCWNEGYQDSCGVKYESICSYPADDGAFDVILKQGSTKYIVAGHDHVNNFMISYKGVRFIYSMKAGAGCYWTPELNGGTCLRVTSKGVADVWHEYVDVSAFL